MSCGQIALERAGIEVGNYFASEIDKWAIQVTQCHYPKTIQLGTVLSWKEWDVPKIDLLIGGSPCQGFSNAGLGLNFDDPRSKLFFTYVDILKALQDKNPELLFLLENVKMKKVWQDIITKELGVKPMMIDSALVSAQSRKRLYWANFSITQPEDKGIILADIIEYGEVDREKSYTIDAGYYKGGSENYLRRIYHGKAKRQVVKYQSAKRLMVTVQSDNDLHYRKLTPIECERLQTVPDNWTSMVSNTQRYKMLGNGWTIDVIAHIFRHLPK